jgi:diaminopimelate epimerase
MKFVKMHGCGNDYVYLDGMRDALPDDVTLAVLAQRMSDRHTGVGSDGLIVLAPPSTAAKAQGADAQMVMFNADGSRSEMCGNGLRCTAKLAWDHGYLHGNATPRFETGAGILDVQLHLDGRQACSGATIRMGVPRLTPSAVPVVHDGPGPRLDLSIAVDGVDHALVAVGMGNPHAICFVPDPEAFPVHQVGPRIENHARFPRRTNVEFVARLPDENGLPVLRQRTWERGAGETQACGTGACAVTVAAILTGVIPGREAIVRLNGGDLHIRWPDDRAEVVMSGPAVTVFSGEWDV